MHQLSACFRRILPASISMAALTIAAPALPAATDTTARDDKPSIRVKASPVVSVAPSRVLLTAEVRGGPNDYEDFYCATVEWDWGDGTKTESKLDCEPYEAGKSQIRRRYTYNRIFRTAGDYNVEFRLKQKNKTVGSARTSIKLRGGIPDGFGDYR